VNIAGMQAFIIMYRPHAAREDADLFPIFAKSCQRTNSIRSAKKCERTVGNRRPQEIYAAGVDAQPLPS
jgi:hypothetical protein